jgi:hypothetical protein
VYLLARIHPRSPKRANMTSERKVVLITGASRGIGAQLSKAYQDIGRRGRQA